MSVEVFVLFLLFVAGGFYILTLLFPSWLGVSAFFIVVYLVVSCCLEAD